MALIDSSVFGVPFEEINNFEVPATINYKGETASGIFTQKIVYRADFQSVNRKLTDFKVRMVVFFEDCSIIKLVSESIKNYKELVLMTLGEKIMRLRQSKGLSQEELGEKMYVSRQAVSKWETGQTMPDVDKIILMSDFFGVTTDYLLKDESESTDYINVEKDNVYENNAPKKSLREKLHFERKSSKTFMGLPLYHINIGLGAYRAKGVFSVGMISTGLISLGLLSVGLLSWGLLSIGLLLALGNISIGCVALGGVAAGVLALGGVAVGVFTIGGCSIGVYSMGGCAIASQIAFGGYAQGYIAIGEQAVGTHAFNVTGDIPQSVMAEVSEIIARELPHTPPFIANMFR